MKAFLQANKLAISTGVALVVGIGCGVLLRIFGGTWSKEFLGLLALPGDIYTRMLKMVVLPLIFPKGRRKKKPDYLVTLIIFP